VLDHALRTSDPTLRAVFAEDSAALIGIVLALAGVGMHQLTGQAAWDAAGSIAVGLLLGVVAIVLIRRNLLFLTGEESDQRLRQAAIETVKSMDDVERVTYLRMEYVGPRKVLLVAAVDMRGDQLESDVAKRLRAVEAQLEEDPNIVDAVLTLSTAEEKAL
jgi:divalent metal cation (Fe/Co/Zn/Cd) transporter